MMQSLNNKKFPTSSIDKVFLILIDLIFLLAGIGFTYAGYKVITVDRKLKQTGIHTVGTVIDTFLETTGGLGGTKSSHVIREHAMVKFQDSDMKERILLSKRGHDIGFYHKLQQVTVIYDKANPDYAVLDEKRSPIIYAMFLIGLVTMGVGFYRLKQIL